MSDFKRFRVENNLTQGAAAKLFGCTQSFISQIEKGLRPIPEDFISKSLAIDVIDSTWLLTGEGNMLKSGEVEASVAAINYDGRGVPYYDVDFIGGFDVVLNDQTVRPTYFVKFPGYESADCWVNVTGHSMEPEVSHGDIVAIKEIKDWGTHIMYGEMYALITEENRTIKYVRRSEEGKDWLRLVPVNKEDYDEQDIPKNVISRVFKVIGAAKRFQ